MRNKREEWLAGHLPPLAAAPIEDWFEHHNVMLAVSGSRVSKLGDFRPPSQGRQQPKISINSDLTPPLMLLVLLHEMAHKETYDVWQRRVSPHGREWQACYQRLLRSHSAFFPEEVQGLMAEYTGRLPLNHALGTRIEALLKGGSPFTVDNLEEGDLFVLKRHPDIVLELGKRRRTRWECRNTETGDRFLVPGAMEVLLKKES